VADGTYTGLGNSDIRFEGKAITVHSANGPGSCVIDGGGISVNRRGFTFVYGEGPTSVLDGFTIVNCWQIDWKGGGIYIEGSAPTIRNCILLDNVADWLGGGIYCLGGAPRIIGCVISGNKAGSYHGVGAGAAIYASSSDLTPENCTITRNESADGGSAGIHIELSSASITRTILRDNCGGVFPDFQGNAEFDCCDFDTAGVEPLGVHPVGPQVFSDPIFCDPNGCGTPQAGADYHLGAGSPCLPENSPCHELIGALGEGCSPVPVDATTWGRVKARYR
jgi:hypothetical protein